ncbi:putative amidase [Nemania abortiva]|nr:putative amidase [Nemania abortiva]
MGEYLERAPDAHSRNYLDSSTSIGSSGSKIPSLRNATIAELSSLLENGSVKSVDLTKTYLARIAEVNDYFRAVIETNPDAVEIAQALDLEQTRTGKRRGPLHGIPILVKDIFNTNDAMHTTAGSLCLLGARTHKEAAVIEKLRAAGAVILGKTNLAEWGMVRTSKGGSGWTARGGLTRGAYVENMKASGSSSGSAVSAALGLAAVCVGAETDGSIISPSSRANVVGLKPTPGLISSEGAIPVALKQDTPGPIARTVADVVYLLDVLADQPDGSANNYAASLTGGDLSGLRNGIPESGFPAADNEHLQAFQKALHVLKDAGAVLITDIAYEGFADFQKLSRDEQTCAMLGAFKLDIASYVKALDRNPRHLTSLDDIIEFIKSDPGEEYPSRGIEMFEIAQKLDLEGQDYKKALARDVYFGGVGGIPGLLKSHGLDVIAVPAMQGPSISFAARAGTPAIVVPLGKYSDNAAVKSLTSGPDHYVDVAPNVPFGIAFLGDKWSETKLLRVANAFEQITQVRESIPLFNPPKTELHGYDAGSTKSSRM